MLIQVSTEVVLLWHVRCDAFVAELPRRLLLREVAVVAGAFLVMLAVKAACEPVSAPGQSSDDVSRTLAGVLAELGRLIAAPGREVAAILRPLALVKVLISPGGSAFCVAAIDCTLLHLGEVAGATTVVAAVSPERIKSR